MTDKITFDTPAKVLFFGLLVYVTAVLACIDGIPGWGVAGAAFLPWMMVSTFAPESVPQLVAAVYFLVLAFTNVVMIYAPVAFFRRLERYKWLVLASAFLAATFPALSYSETIFTQRSFAILYSSWYAGQLVITVAFFLKHPVRKYASCCRICGSMCV